MVIITADSGMAGGSGRGRKVVVMIVSIAFSFLFREEMGRQS
jgi:hypothetical protein